VLAHEHFELTDEGSVAAGGQIGLDAPLEAGEAELLEASDLVLGEELVGELGKRRAAPEPKPLDDLAARYQLLEAIEIELPGFDLELVAGRAREDAVLPERLAELGDVHLECLLGRSRRLLTPESVDQVVARDDAVRVEEEDGEQRPLLGGADVDRPAVVDDLERPQDTKVHRLSE
jgi:hypothetical protein